MADNPYRSLPDHRFWRKAVTSLPPFAIDPIIETPFKISRQDKVATAGSCFAQEIAQRLQSSGFHYYLAEQPPAGVTAGEALRRNYSMYSCRYGNIYTTAQLLQLIDRASMAAFSLNSTIGPVRRTGGYQPFRPRMEPDGYASVEDMRADRKYHFESMRNLLETMDVFVFTFGHTETWRHKKDGAILQLHAAGVAGGASDPRGFRIL